MKFFVIEFQETAEGAVTHLVTTHDTRAEAESKYHTVLSYAAVSGLRRHSAAIITPDGFVQKRECYENIPEPEPEPEAEE